MNGNLREDRYTFSIISHSVLLKMKNVSDKSCRETRNTHFMFSNFLEIRVVYEIMWEHIVEWGRPHMTIKHMQNACAITKATDTYPEYVILNMWK